MHGDIIDYRGKWCLKLRLDGKRRRVSLGNIDATPENHPLAERAAHEIQVQLVQPVGSTLADVFPAYVADRDAHSRTRQLDSWKALSPQFGALGTGDITRDVCRHYVERRTEQGRAVNTIRRELADLRAAVNWYDKHNRAVFELPAPAEPRNLSLTRDEFSRLLRAAEGTFHLSVFLHLAIATAGRKEAILTMTWPQVNWDKGEIWLGFKPNGKKRPTVPMTETLRAVLTTARAVAVTGTIVEYEGAPVASVKKAFRAAVVRAGLEPPRPWLDDDRPATDAEIAAFRAARVTIHDIRHTAAVWMVGAGVDMSKISQYLGHSDTRITERVYARYKPDHLRDAARALEV